MKTTPALLVIGLVLSAVSIRADDKEKWDINQVDVSKLPAAANRKDLTYAKDIRPLFEASCFRCHGERKPKGGLRLDSLEVVLKGGEDGKMVVAGDSKKSLLVAAAARIDDEIAMPPKHRPGCPGGLGGPGGPRPNGDNNRDGRPPGHRRQARIISVRPGVARVVASALRQSY